MPSLLRRTFTGLPSIHWKSSVTAVRRSFCWSSSRRSRSSRDSLISCQQQAMAPTSSLPCELRFSAVIREATSATDRQAEDSAAAPLAHGGQVVALVSGKGAPGTTTLAISLASALADSGSRVALVDADLRGGGVAPYLDLDPRRGLIGLTIGPPSDDVVGAELQEASGFSVLAGIERPEMRDRVAPEHLVTALAVLRQRFEITVVDVGQSLAGTASDAAGAVVRNADQVLVVTTAGLTGLWNTRHCLRYLQESLGLRARTVRVVDQSARRPTGVRRSRGREGSRRPGPRDDSRRSQGGVACRSRTAAAYRCRRLPSTAGECPRSRIDSTGYRLRGPASRRSATFSLATTDSGSEAVTDGARTDRHR